MKTQKVQFDGKAYDCRVVESNEGEELLIGSTLLLDALQPGSFEDKNEGFASEEAGRIYDGIIFLYQCVNPSAQRRETDSRVEEGQPGLVRVKQINNHFNILQLWKKNMYCKLHRPSRNSW